MTDSSPLLFLSHAGVDSDAALALAARIEASPEAQRHGLRVWIDRRAIVPGTPWQDQIEDAIRQRSTAFGIYVTRAGADHWVRMEVRAALDRVIDDGRQGRTYPFIPILVDEMRDVSRLPPFARQYQGVCLADGETALQRLIAVALGRDGSATGSADRVALVAEPFVGLEAFAAHDAHLFFGRERETADLIAAMRTSSLLIVVGDRLMPAIESEWDNSDLMDFAYGLIALSAHVDDERAVSIYLRAFRNPFTAGQPTDILLDGLRSRFKSELSQQASLWDVVAFSQRRAVRRSTVRGDAAGDVTKMPN